MNSIIEARESMKLGKELVYSSIVDEFTKSKVPVYSDEIIIVNAENCDPVNLKVQCDEYHQHTGKCLIATK